jgi:hypothetical protein
MNMALSIWTISAVLSAHYVADFLLQSDWMAKGKSKAWLPLLVHVAIYTAAITPLGWRWALFNGLCHLATDAVTSRISSHFFAKHDYHNGFAVVGADQLIHALTLFWSWGHFHAQ